LVEEVEVMTYSVQDPEVQALFEDEGPGVKSGRCPKCGGSTWEPVEEIVDGKLERRVRRCNCWIRAVESRQKGDRLRVGHSRAAKRGISDQEELDQKTLAAGGR
jgi:hypothetical protein